MLTLIAALLVLVLPAPALPGGQDVPQEKLEARIEKVARAVIDDESVRGMSLLVDVGREELFAAHWGTMSFGEVQAVRADSRWPAASLLEQLTVIAALQLVEDGLLDLADPVSRHLAGMEWEDHEVTLHHLMTQTSGVTAYDRLPPRRPTDEGLGELPQRQDPWQRLAGEGLESAPGQCLTYSNSNQLLLGAVVEQVTGRDLQTVISERAFERLGMGASGFRPGLARALGVDEVHHHVAGWVESDGDGTARFGAGDLTVTVGDLALLMHGIADRSLLGETTFERMIGEHRLGDGTLVGHGYGVNHTPLNGIDGFSFAGGLADAHLHVAWYPSLDVTVALMADATEVDLEALERHVVRVIFGLRGPDLEDFDLDDEELATYTGTYMMGCNYVYVSAKGGHLFFAGVDLPTHELLYQGRDVFAARTDPEVRLTFQLEAGSASGFVLAERGTLTNAKRIH